MFEDRVDAGLKLCPRLKRFAGKSDTLVAGLTRGGVATAKALSKTLNLKLYPLIVKKIPAPGNEELAIGAIVSPEAFYLNRGLIKRLKISDSHIDAYKKIKLEEIGRLSARLKINYEGFKNKNIILVDDGVATGASVLAAEIFLRKKQVNNIILATPVIAQDTLSDIRKHFDGIVFLIKERDFYSVGQFYKNFGQILDEEVAKILGV